MSNVYLEELTIKSVSRYRSLTMGDQIALLRGATFEVMQIRFNMVFNVKTSIWECGHITYCIDDGVRGETTYTNQGQTIYTFKGLFLLCR